MLSTLVLANNTLVPGNFNATNPSGENPIAGALDPSTGLLYVADGTQNAIYVVSDASNQILRTIYDAYGPYALEFDAKSNEVFVANFAADNVSIISAASNSIVHNVTVGSKPYALAYDSGRNQIFVANYGSGNISVISAVTDRVVKSVRTGGVPNQLVYDAGQHEVFAVDHDGYPTSTVWIIADSNDTIVHRVTVGADPVGIAYDPSAGEVFVSDGPAMPTDNISVINDTSNSIVATIAVGDEPLGLTYDASTGNVVVANFCGGPVDPSSCPGSLSVIDVAGGSVIATVPVGGGPWNVLYDSRTSLVYVFNYAQGTISIVSMGPTVRSEPQEYPDGEYVNGVASIGAVALVSLGFPNGTAGLALFDAETNTSTTVEAENPGGAGAYGTAMVAAGRTFLVAWYNSSTDRVTFQKVSLLGKVGPVALPLSRHLAWAFDWANSSVLFATYGRILIEVDLATLTVDANLTKDVPSTVGIDAVLPVGQLLYLAGARLEPKGGTAAYLGYLNLTTHKVTSISPTDAHQGAHILAVFYDLLDLHGDVYAGGATFHNASGVLNESVVAGLFYEYSPSGTTYTNLSSILPHSDWAVWGMAPWGSSLALSLNWFDLDPSQGILSVSGGVFAVAPSGTSLLNESAQFPDGYLPDVIGETAGSDGWFFSGGYTTPYDTGFLVAVKG